MTAVVIQLAIGLIAGAVFSARTLLVLIACAIVKCLVISIIYGIEPGLWALAGMLMLQVGYLAGIALRAALEQAGIAQPGFRPRRLP